MVFQRVLLKDACWLDTSICDGCPSSETEFACVWATFEGPLLLFCVVGCWQQNAVDYYHTALAVRKKKKNAVDLVVVVERLSRLNFTIV